MGSHFSITKILDPLGLFTKDKKPKPEKAPELNTQADKDAQDAAAAEERRRAAAGGRASTIFTGALGDTSTPNTASKVLLGD